MNESEGAKRIKGKFMLKDAFGIKYRNNIVTIQPKLFNYQIIQESDPSLQLFFIHQLDLLNILWKELLIHKFNRQPLQLLTLLLQRIT